MRNLMLLNPRKRTRKRTRKTSARRTVKRRVIRKRTRKSAVAVAAPKRRRKVRRSTGGSIRFRRIKLPSRAYLKTNPGGSLMSMAKGLVSKDNLLLAGGVVAAPASLTIINNLLAKNNIKLPGTVGADGKANEYVGMAYSLAIPLVAAYALRRISPTFAKGLLIGSTANVVAALVNKVTGPAATTGEYINEYLDRPGVAGISYDGMKRFQGVSSIPNRSGNPYNSDPAFPTSAWDSAF